MMLIRMTNVDALDKYNTDDKNMRFLRMARMMIQMMMIILIMRIAI